VTYGQFRDFVLSLINQYSANDKQIVRDYNDQADYVNRIPRLYNDAMSEIASQTDEFTGVMDVGVLPKNLVRPGWIAVTPPEDYMRMTGAGIPVVRGGVMYRSNDYHVMGDGRVVLSAELFRNGLIEYCRKPRRLDVEPQELTGAEVLDGPDECNYAAAYHVAALLVLEDNPYMYSVLESGYEDRLKQIKTKLRADTGAVCDSYALNYDPYSF